MTKEELDKVIEGHGRWLRDEEGGACANLRNADLRDADLRDADLCNANLHNADLYNADLRNADLRDAHLYNADLRNADLRNADLYNADLRKANLRNADLRDTDLRNANLRNADLYNADLRNANLRNADLYNADLRNADLPIKVLQVGPVGSRRDCVVYNFSDDNIRCGCWNNYKGGTLEEFEARVEEVYPQGREEKLRFRNEYMTVIAYFKAVREMYLKEKEEGL